jgi:uncharacterized protein (TIGR02421 family)
MSAADIAGFSGHDLAVERTLADIGSSFQFLLDVTPTNLPAARESFLAGRADAPDFEYRPLEDSPEVLSARLAEVDTEAVEDATLSQLVRAKHRELRLQVEMLTTRNSSTFPTLSIELYGAVSPTLLSQAEEILGRSHPAVPIGSWLGADEFARRADEELGWYRERHPDLDVHIEVRPDCSAVMVSNGNLLIPSSARVADSRVDAILQHEIGTHVVTHVNGARQPIRLLAALAGYDETQEGLALVAEYLVGGLTTTRVRQLAGRVVAVQLMLDGASFRATHARLVDAGFSHGAAFVTTMRAFRSGGLTKDAVYLRGLLTLLDHIGSGCSIQALFLGKMPLDALALVVELRDRGALDGPMLVPHYLVRSDSITRLHAIRPETTVGDLLASAK